MGGGETCRVCGLYTELSEINREQRSAGLTCAGTQQRAGLLCMVVAELIRLATTGGESMPFRGLSSPIQRASAEAGDFLETSLRPVYQRVQSDIAELQDPDQAAGFAFIARALELAMARLPGQASTTGGLHGDK